MPIVVGVGFATRVSRGPRTGYGGPHGAVITHHAAELRINPVIYVTAILVLLVRDCQAVWGAVR